MGQQLLFRTRNLEELNPNSYPETLSFGNEALNPRLKASSMPVPTNASRVRMKREVYKFRALGL